MRNHTKTWLIAAIVLILAGGLLFTFALGSCGWDLTKLSTTEFETNAYDITEPFSHISINTTTADILFVPSDDELCKVVCFEETSVKHTVTVQNGTLTLEAADKKSWYSYIGVSLHSPKLTVYLPQEEYGTLTVQARTGDVEIPEDFTFEAVAISGSTGDIANRASAEKTITVNIRTGRILLEDVSAEAIELSVSTGSMTLTDILCDRDISLRSTTGKTRLSGIRCNNLQSRGNSGVLLLEDVIATGSLSLTRTSGDIKLDACDASTLVIKVNTGDVTGTLLTDKIFMVQANTGTVDVPKTITGGKCEITATTGDIQITIP